MYYEDVTGLDLQTDDESVLDIYESLERQEAEENSFDGKDLQEIDEDYQGDVIVCLSCSHLAHYHRDKLTGEQTDTCSKPGCNCQSYEPEICN